MNTFGASSTTDDVLRGVDLKGKRVLVTGVSAGLGVETARALVAHGAQVVGTARDIAKAVAATATVQTAAAGTNGGSFDLAELDLASLASVRALGAALRTDGRQFDVVIANAGVMATPFGRTADGFETQFGTNHLGHFALLGPIAPLIADNGRVVVLSSAGHRQSDIDLDDPNFEHTAYDPWTAYARSKTATVLMAVEFDRRHRARGIRACAIMPGVINTELSRHMTQDQLDAAMAALQAASARTASPPLEYKTIAQGAATSVWAAFVAVGEAIGGRYCENCQVADVTDAADRPDGVRSYAIDPQRAKELWALSEQLVGESF